jgi:serine/threonine protein kinase
MRERDIFDAALAIARPEERDAFLADACAGDTGLEEHLRNLLEAERGLKDFLEMPASPPDFTAELPGRTEAVGSLIGPYRLMEQVGEGGMGVVYVAEQREPLRRKVALKVIRPGMDSRQVVARFEAERQALAMMDHPNIAKVHDGGTTPSGRPYFVMELVRGLPITEYCDREGLPIRERLELFVLVCRAVQHAHQKGVIHRDLKPSNVLVTLHDGVPVPKVIDFGVAKATGQALTDKTLYTGIAQLVGTPLYMSPEQVEMSGLDVDTRSDIYSLGVLLYELLTGTTPFDAETLKRAAFDEMRRIIRDQEPQRPSLKLSSLGETLTTVSAKRSAAPRQLGLAVRGELDWIVMKALEKDRRRRYETAGDLAADVLHYLDDEPVQACPPSAGYRLRTFARRNKRALLTLGLVMAALVAGTAISAWQALIATRARALAQERLEDAEANLLLARRAVDEIYTPVAGQLAFVPLMQPYQRDILEKALPFYQVFARRQGRDPILRRESAGALLTVGSIQGSLGHPRQAKEPCEAALAALEGLAAELPADPQRRTLLGKAYLLRGTIQDPAGRRRQAEASFRQALALHGALAAEHPGDPAHRINLIADHQALGDLLSSDRPREAERAFRAALQIADEMVAQRPDRDHHPVYPQGISYFKLGNLLVKIARFQEAESVVRQALALMDQSRESSDRAQLRFLRPPMEWLFGEALAGCGQREAAERAYRQAVAGWETLATQNPDLPDPRRNLLFHSAKLSAFLTQVGKPDEAAPFRRRVRELLEDPEVGLANDSESWAVLADACSCFRVLGDLEAAERPARQALALAGKLAEEKDVEPIARWRVARSHWELGLVLQRRGRIPEASDQFRRALTLHERLAAEFPDDPTHRCDRARMLNFLGIALRSRPGYAPTALQCHQQAIELAGQLVAAFPDSPWYRRELVRSHFSLGIVLRLTGRHAEAAQAFQQALDDYRRFSDTGDDPDNRTQFASVHNEWAWMLATCPYLANRDPGRAVTLARKAVALEPELGGFWNTLGVACYRAGDWTEALSALTQSMDRRRGGDPADWYFLAMAHRQLGHPAEARSWYDRAVQWMEQRQSKDQELRGFRAEAAALLGVEEEE